MTHVNRYMMAIDSGDGTGFFVPQTVLPGTLKKDGTEKGQAATRTKVGASDVDVASTFGTHSSNGSSQITSVVANNKRARLSHIVFTGPATPAAGIVTIHPFAQTASSPKEIVKYNQSTSPGTTGVQYGMEVPLEFVLDGGFCVQVATAGQSFYIVYELEQVGP